MAKKLEEVLEVMNEQEETQQQQPFMVSDLETAAEAQRRLTYFRDRKLEIDAIAEKQIAPFKQKIEMLQMWAEEAKQEYSERYAYYQSLLEYYMREQVEEQGKKAKKSIKLPYGKIQLKKQQPEFYKDEELLLEYAKSNGFVKVKESTDWMEIKKKCSVLGNRLIDENGEVVPGVVVNERDDKFYIELEV